MKPLPIPKQMTTKRINELLNEHDLPITQTLSAVAWKVWAETREYFHYQSIIMEKYITTLEQDNERLRALAKSMNLELPSNSGDAPNSVEQGASFIVDGNPMHDFVVENFSWYKRLFRKLFPSLWRKKHGDDHTCYTWRIPPGS